MFDLFDNPMGLMGFEFVEFASPRRGVLEPVFEKLGFSLGAKRSCRRAGSCSTAARRTASRASCCRSSRRRCSGRCSSSSSNAKATTASARATSRRCSSRSSAIRCGAACCRRRPDALRIKHCVTVPAATANDRTCSKNALARDTHRRERHRPAMHDWPREEHRC